MIKLNQQIITANEQDFTFDQLIISDGASGSLKATIIFTVKNEKGVYLGKKIIEVKDELFNDFWTNFNSASFLYEELSKQIAITVTETDKTRIEQSFVNPIRTIKPLPIENLDGTIVG